MPVSRYQLSYLVVIAFVTVFFGAAVWNTNTAWDSYRDSRNQDLWKKSKCTIKSIETNNNSCAGESNPPLAKVDAVVSSVEQRSDLVNIKARLVFDNQKECAKLSNVTAYVGLKKEGDEVDCWVYGSDVRLDAIGFLDRDQLRRRLSAIFLTLFTIVFGLMLIIYVRRTVSVMMLSSPRRPSSPSNRRILGREDIAAHMPQEPALALDVTAYAMSGNTRRRRLSANDAHLLMAEFKNVDGVPSEESPCPICLEEFCDGDADNTTRLPCNHIYHTHCALPWFSKGHTACPYCAYDMSTDFANLRACRSDRKGEAESASDAAAALTGGHEAGSSQQWRWAWTQADSENERRRRRDEETLEP